MLVRASFRLINSHHRRAEPFPSSLNRHRLTTPLLARPAPTTHSRDSVTGWIFALQNAEGLLSEPRADNDKESSQAILVT